ncbi:MAG: hypothetical protein LAN18_12785 [Acidobacteriia bacterium]|nr:hypothetical protein [Terriglobia bacterium]
MPATYCEVALPVPLHSLFTYAIPDRLAGLIVTGTRVLVPFRNRAMTGVVVEASSRLRTMGWRRTRKRPVTFRIGDDSRRTSSFTLTGS